jgi:hypothetical protein
VLPRPWGPPWPGGSWPPLAAGAVTLTAGSASLLALNCQSPVWILAAVSVVFGAQNGLSLVTSQAAMYAQAPAAQTGTAAGLRTFMYLGAIASAGITGFAFGARATAAGLHHLAVILTITSAVLLAATLAGRDLHHRAATSGQGRTEARSQRQPRQPQLTR